MKPEEKARQEIDQLFKRVGRKVQDYCELDLGASLGGAVREFPLKSEKLITYFFIDRKPVGVIEAKPFGTTLSGVEEETIKNLLKGN